MLKDINDNGSAFWYSSTCPSPSFTKAGNNLYFRANDGTNGYELFKTDGTENGTVMVKDISIGGSDALNESVFFAEYNDVLYFKANDGIFGSELWRSDGTEVGTYLLKDINSNSGDSFYSTNAYNRCLPSRKQHTIFNNLLYFKAFDGSANKIWRTDGTNGGTIATSITQSGIIDFEIIDSNNNVLFFWSDLDYGDIPKLWASDDNTTHELLYTYQLASQSLNESTFVFNDELYFSETLNSILMKTDGTLNGTITLKDLDYSPVFIGVCGNYLYFTIGNISLWRTDGTNEGTVEVGDFTSGNFRSSVIFENTLFLLNSLNDKVIYYINDNMNSTEYLNINVLNSDNFLGYDSTWHLSKTNNNLFLDANTQISGDELYKVDVSQITLSVEEAQLEQNNDKTKVFTVYPNPVDNNIILSSKNNITISKVEIFDSLGKKVYDSIQNNKSIDLSYLNNGLYFLKIYSIYNVETHKLIKK
ncbi:T9SS type A sorting domain-containing protein [Psychroserpens damuponensis]|uniref:T9SS type A sorting domain-containing protein n=1 Tax=Psychroserpens damuponensis TaxID=943936 RepID=UPI00058D73F4